MKSKTAYERQHCPKPLFQSGFASHLAGYRTTSSSAQFSLDKNIRRMSPAPQERFSHVPNHVIYQVPSYPGQEYQLGYRQNDLYSQGAQADNRLIQELLQRIQKLQCRGEKWDKLEQRVQKVQANTARIESKIQSFECRKEESFRGKENLLSHQNKLRQEQLNKIKSKHDFVTKDDLQRQLTSLDNAFKSFFTSFRTSINAEIGDYNLKNKKKFIEITASQLSQKLEHFKANFLKEWTGQIQNVVKDTWSSEFVGKSVIGVSKQKFVGSVVPVIVKEELSVLHGEKSKQLTVVETTYYLDKNGCLLDNQMHYLLDKNNKEIKLQQDKIDLLRKQGILDDLLLSQSQLVNTASSV